MRFKRIELLGFKSFADKTVINFDDGITAIVGPNGCGKSNVADSIRWVLGEQSSKLLRGSSMQDVIFNGTQARKSLSYCEVSLVLDNSNHDVNIDYNEVKLTRKLYRSGESEYLINNNESRLKDIVDILHDAGIGRDGYSIIGQGKVEQIVSSKPENRRGIFEEAAGISKFKEKKLESERKLERTRENISRLKDIMIEIERQLNPLKEQAEKAKKYLELSEELKSLEINNYIYQYDNAASDKQEISIRINGLAEEIDSRQKDLDTAIASYNKSYADIQKIDDTMKSLYNQVTELTVALERKSGQTNILKERLALLKEQADRLDNELKQEQQNLKQLSDQLTEKENKIQLNVKNINVLKESNEEINKKYLSVVDEITRSEDEAEHNQQMMFSVLNKLSDVKADISKLNAEKLACMDRQVELQKQLDEAMNSNKKNSSEMSNLADNLAQKTSTRTEMKNKLDELKGFINSSTTNLNNMVDEYNETNSAFASLSARKNMLEEMQKNFDGFNGAVKNILENAQRNAELKKSFVGVVANLVKVPEKYQTAIEMALGGAVQNIVTENEDDAQKIINYLKQNRCGRATFLPITSLKPRSIANYVDLVSDDPGYLGIASELVNFDKKLNNIFQNLLGGTAIVDNLVSAVRIAKKTRYGFKIVTLEGDVINPQGSITGGSKSRNSANVIGRDEEIKQLSIELAKLIDSKTKLSNDITELKGKISQKQIELNEISTTYSDLCVEIGKINEIKNQYESANKLYTSRINEISEQINSIKTKIKAIDEQLSHNDQLKSNMDDNKQDAGKNIEKRQQDFDNLKKERDDYNAKVLDIKVKIAAYETESSSLEKDIERIKNDINTSNEKINKINEDVIANNDTISKAENIINATVKDADYVEIDDKLKQVKEKLSSLGTYKNTLQDQLKQYEEDRVTLTTKLNKLQDRIYQENVNLTKVDTDIENMQERVWTEYGLNYSSAISLKRPDYNLDEGLKKATETKRGIDRLGYVNVNAIEDSKVYQERFDQYSTQVADLTKAENDLTKIITDLAAEMTTRFQTSFDTINSNFGRVFKELFGGGSATLELVPSESGDVLEAGVDIKVEPPGKKLQSITLLSGGEKALTAIAILFAILKLRAMPFVLLDEIEAALDDANVGRFAKYLKNFSGETQFIVITHRKPTMELADNLYGVTMPEKGVSKVVSVKLSEAIAVDNQQENNKKAAA